MHGGEQNVFMSSAECELDGLTEKFFSLLLLGDCDWIGWASSGCGFLWVVHWQVGLRSTCF